LLSEELAVVYVTAKAKGIEDVILCLFEQGGVKIKSAIFGDGK